LWKLGAFMGIFKNSDKKSDASEWLDLSDLALVDLSKEFNTALTPDDLVFGKFTKDEILAIMEECGLISMLHKRGYPSFNIDINVLSLLDNRIFVKTLNGDILIHIRLKYSDFSFKVIPDSFKMVYIDWLLTQNIKFQAGNYTKQLFYGQEYPGLAIFVEITEFIRLLTKKLGAHGVFNIPEYFHDAVLFRNHFKYVDPAKEGQFRALLQLSLTKRVRDLSNAIHQKKLVWDSTGEIFEWFYAEMLTCVDPFLETMVFNDEYYKKVEESKARTKFKFL
jgi:hypothetical protein